jgi:hypothetical protein
MGTDGRGRDEELGVVRERTETWEQRDEVGMKNLALWEREWRHGNRWTRQGWRTWRWERENGDMGTEGRGRDEELGVVRENGDMRTDVRGRDEELGVVRENWDMRTERRVRDEELGVVRENGDMGTEGRGRDEELGVV